MITAESEASTVVFSTDADLYFTNVETTAVLMKYTIENEEVNLLEMAEDRIAFVAKNLN